jgi:hypothetical protein
MSLLPVLFSAQHAYIVTTVSQGTLKVEFGLVDTVKSKLVPGLDDVLLLLTHL